MRSTLFRSLLLNISAFLTFMFGSFDVALQTLIYLIIADFVTGIISGFLLKELNSQRAWKGIFKKCLFLVVVSVATRLDEIAHADGLARVAIIYLFIATEGLSILENCVKWGLPIPSWLVERLEQFRNLNDKGGK